MTISVIFSNITTKRCNAEGGVSVVILEAQTTFLSVISFYYADITG